MPKNSKGHFLKRTLPFLSRYGLSRDQTDIQLRNELLSTGLFDPRTYREEYGDVSSVPEEAYFHYMSYGWREGRRPNPAFDPNFYLAKYPDVEAAGVEPLSHFYWQGIKEGRTPRDPYEAKFVKGGSSPVSFAKLVIGIPVYGNAELTSRCAHSVISNYPAVRLHLHDDGSNDREVDQLLQELLGLGVGVSQDRINRGFPSSANLIIEQYPEDDVLLVNSDCVVFPGLVQAMRRAAGSSPRVASVTALSNNATIASYPNWPVGQDISLEEAKQIGRLQTRANLPNGEIPMLPTAVGSCMLLARTAINDVGGFDSQAFGRGYGEENDWSLRATQRGWFHLLAPDTYVFHEGGASFADLAPQLQSQASGVLFSKYPEYEAGISKWINSVVLGEWLTAFEIPSSGLASKAHDCHVTHGFGGGTTSTIKAIPARTGNQLGYSIRLEVARAAVTAYVSPTHRSNWIERIEFRKVGEDAFRRALDELQISQIHLHDPTVLTISDLALLGGREIEINFWYHDARLLCAQGFMVLPDGTSCSGPDPGKCSRCVALSGPFRELGVQEHKLWSESIKASFDQVIHLSESAERDWKVFSGSNTPIRRFDMAKAEFLEPEASYLSPSPDPFNLGSPETSGHVLLVGHLANHKGAGRIRDLVDSAFIHFPRIHFSLAGDWVSDTMPPLTLRQCGAYVDAEELAQQIAESFIDCILFVSPSRETFSHALSDALSSSPANVRFVLPDAPIWRERMRGSTHIVDWFDPTVSTQQLLGQVVRALKQDGKPER